MSPYFPTRLFYDNSDKFYDNHMVASDSSSVVPVINLRPDVGYTTDDEGEPGTSSNPYTIQ